MARWKNILKVHLFCSLSDRIMFMLYPKTQHLSLNVCSCTEFGWSRTSYTRLIGPLDRRVAIGSASSNLNAWLHMLVWGFENWFMQEKWLPESVPLHVCCIFYCSLHVQSFWAGRELTAFHFFPLDPRHREQNPAVPESCHQILVALLSMLIFYSEITLYSTHYQNDVAFWNMRRYYLDR